MGWVERRERHRYTEPPSSACICLKLQDKMTASSSMNAGSKAARPGCPMPISGVIID